MPPKKDPAKGAAGDEPEPDEEEREMVEKELVISYLRTKLGRYQERGEVLMSENLKLYDELEVQRLNLHDINEFLTNELKARALSAAEVERQLAAVQAELETVRAEAQEELKRVQREKEAEADSYVATISEMEKKMRMSREFLEQKDSLEAEILTLKEALVVEKRNHEKKVSDLERQHVQDKDKWKKEMAARIKEVREKMQRMTENQLESLTKRTILENEQMDLELRYQSRQVEKLVHKNSALGEEVTDMRRQLRLAKQTEQELAKRNWIYQNAIKSLLVRLMSQNNNADERDGLAAALGERADAAEERAEEAEAALAAANEEAEDLRGQLEACRARLDQFDETARFLAACADDLRSRLGTVTSASPSPDPTPSETRRTLTSSGGIPATSPGTVPGSPGSSTFGTWGLANSSLGTGATGGPGAGAVGASRFASGTPDSGTGSGAGSSAAGTPVLGGPNPTALDQIPTAEQRRRALEYLLGKLRAAGVRAAGSTGGSPRATTSSEGIVLPSISSSARGSRTGRSQGSVPASPMILYTPMGQAAGQAPASRDSNTYQFTMPELKPLVSRASQTAPMLESGLDGSVLYSQLVSEVRPWGKRAEGSILVPVKGYTVLPLRKGYGLSTRIGAVG